MTKKLFVKCGICEEEISIFDVIKHYVDNHLEDLS